MKRNTLTLITIALLAAIALCACNMDATDGIYSEVASSTESKDVVMNSYLGKYSDEYYYLADDGVFKKGSSTALIASTRGKIIRSASLDESTGDILILVQDRDSLKGQIYLCTAANDYAIGDPINDNNYTGLLVNGIIVKTEFDDENNENKVDVSNSGIYYGSSATEVVSGVSVEYYLETEEYAFFSVKDSSDAYKFYVFKDGSALFNVDGDATQYVGFQPLSDSTFVLVSYNSSNNQFNAYQLIESSGVAKKSWFTLKDTLRHTKGSQAASFCYTHDTSTYMVIKCNNYFDRVDVTDTAETNMDDKVTSLSTTGFASDLRTTEITNIKKTSTDNVFIVGTYDSLLYQIDLTADDIQNSSATQL